MPKKSEKLPKFLRLAPKRTKQVLEGLRKIGNLSSTNYKAEPEEIEQIFATIEAGVKEARSKFASKLPTPKLVASDTPKVTTKPRASRAKTKVVQTKPETVYEHLGGKYPPSHGFVSMITLKCRCGKSYQARRADINRGRAKSCSKSCAAKLRESRTGVYAKFMAKQNNYRGSGVDRDTYLSDQKEFGGTPQYSRSGHYEGFRMSPEELASGGHGSADWDTPFGDGKW